MNTGSAIFYDAKMHIVSYCIIAAFHHDLKLHVIIYCSFDQTKEELNSLEHFLVCHKLQFENFSSASRCSFNSF